MDLLLSLLHDTSRSFALSIPAAPAPVDREMTVAYLLFRIADTFEDATATAVEERIQGLEAFAHALDNPSCPKARAALREHAERLDEPNPAYRRLMRHCDEVLDGLMSLRPGAQVIVAGHSRRTAVGCIEWIRRTDDSGVLRLHSMKELRDYCYTVAGIPGEMLCELFLLEQPGLEHVAAQMRARAVTFGEAMQLVNILKDCAMDAEEDRVFLPSSVSMTEALALARADLAVAREYVELLRQPGVPSGVVAFHQITSDLAAAALDVTEAKGPGAKISRSGVARILEHAGVSAAQVQA